MSWTFHLQKINQSFERIASWYSEFMHRTEICFRALNERIMYLEERQHGPSDEQVERVLRKILAEKFSGDGLQRVETPRRTKDDSCFVEDRNESGIPRPVIIDPASLLVEPDAVPSKAYAETFDMLERRVAAFPDTDPKKAA